MGSGDRYLASSCNYQLNQRGCDLHNIPYISMIREQLTFIRNVISKSQNDFSFGFHPAGFSLFKPANGQRLYFRIPGKLSLAHKKFFPYFPYDISAQSILLT